MRKVKKQKRDHRRRSTRPGARPVEDRRSDAITIAWTMCALATTLALAAGIAGMFLVTAPHDAERLPGALGLLTPVMLFTASVTGLVGLCLTPLVYLFRRVPPPLAVTVAIVAITVSPFVLLVLFSA